jgi:PBP1b-binding outer membrane lipoprotein LpoB
MNKQKIIFLIITSLFLTSCFSDTKDTKKSDKTDKKKIETKINKYYDIEKVQSGSISLNESYISYAK